MKSQFPQQIEYRLIAIEVAIKEHQKKIKKLIKEAEQLSRDVNILNSKLKEGVRYGI